MAVVFEDKSAASEVALACSRSEAAVMSTVVVSYSSTWTKMRCSAETSPLALVATYLGGVGGRWGRGED